MHVMICKQNKTKASKLSPLHQDASRVKGTNQPRFHKARLRSNPPSLSPLSLDFPLLTPPTLSLSLSLSLSARVDSHRDILFFNTISRNLNLHPRLLISFYHVINLLAIQVLFLFLFPYQRISFLFFLFLFPFHFSRCFLLNSAYCNKCFSFHSFPQL